MLKLNSTLRNLLGTHGEPQPTKPNMPLFIMGCMRSGTTYLANKLTGHPQLLKIGTELNSVWTKIGGASILGHCDYKGPEDANCYYTYQMSNYFFRFINESKSLKRHLMRANIYYSRGIGRIGYDWENLVPVNKSPHLMNKVGYINKLFPQSKYIFIVRDIFGHSASMKVHFNAMYKNKQQIYYIPENPKACWSSLNKSKALNRLPHKFFPQNFELIPQMWIRLNKLAFDAINLLDKEQFIIVNYEDLIENKEMMFRQIFQFLDLNPKHHKHEIRVAKTTVKYRNTTTKGNPLYKWKKQLTKEEIDSIHKTIDYFSDDYSFVMDALNSSKIR